MKRGLQAALILALGAALVVWLLRQFLPPRSHPLPPSPRTTGQVLAALGADADARLSPYFEKAGVPYPPARIVILAFKDEKRLELYARGGDGPFIFIRSWPILAASGTEGIKRREGDRQVPEGFYRIESLNPNSRFHLSLRVDYPNADDLARADAEGQDRETLGGDIMIHGDAVSAGCLAMGDPAAEELFVLAARCGISDLRLLIAPRDLRGAGPQETALNERLRVALREYPPER